MDEILRNLPAGSLVLDLGSNCGSFASSATPATTIRADCEAQTTRRDAALFVQCDAANLPFRDHSFQAIISNHSLEHFADAEGVLREIGRVAAPNGSLYIAVPDASTFTDKVYRWLARGGGHVNAFVSASQTVAWIERLSGLPHTATRVLYSSLSFLNRRNMLSTPRCLNLLGGGYESTLFVYAWLSRRVDRILGTRFSLYGWAFYFGQSFERVNVDGSQNVCIRCGAGASSFFLLKKDLVRASFLSRVWNCPGCLAINPYIDDLNL